jgi:hypothetical protein
VGAPNRSLLWCSSGDDLRQVARGAIAHAPRRRARPLRVESGHCGGYESTRRLLTGTARLLHASAAQDATRAPPLSGRNVFMTVGTDADQCRRSEERQNRTTACRYARTARGRLGQRLGRRIRTKVR